jgi:hypothetical protein
MRSPFKLVKTYIVFRLRRALNLLGLEAEAGRLSVGLASGAREAAEGRRALEQAIDRLAAQLQRVGDDLSVAQRGIAAGLGEVRGEISAATRSFAADVAAARAEQRSIATTLSDAITAHGNELKAIDARATESGAALRARLDEFHAALGRATELATEAVGRVEAMRAHILHLDTAVGAVDAGLSAVGGEISAATRSFAADVAAARAEQRSIATTLSDAITEHGSELKAIDARATELATEAVGRVEAMRAHILHLDTAVGAVDAGLSAVGREIAAATQSFAADVAAARAEQRSIATTLSDAITAQGSELKAIDARASESGVVLRARLDEFNATLGRATGLATEATGRVEAMRAHILHLDTAVGAVDAGLSAVGEEISAATRSFAADVATARSEQRSIATTLSDAITEHGSELKAIETCAAESGAALRARLDEFHATLGRAMELASEAAGRVEAMRSHILHLDTAVGAVDAGLTQTRNALDPGGALFGFIRQGQMVSLVPELTFVCSRGRTGTQWLTEALNLHPDILAAHGPMSPPVWFHGKPSVRLRAAVDQQWHSRLGGLSLAQCREEMALAGPARYYALVHALTVPEVAEKLGKEPSSGQMATVNVVRHPVPRINSFQAEWLLGDPVIYAPLHGYLLDRWRQEPLFAQYRERIARRFDVDFTARRNIFFVMACYWLRYDQNDFEFPVRHFAYERLVVERDYMADFLRAAFGPSFAVSDEHLEAITRLGPRNARAEGPVAPEAVFAAWQEWQKYCFTIVFEDIDLLRTYADFGYEFSFAAAPARRIGGVAGRPQAGVSPIEPIEGRGAPREPALRPELRAVPKGQHD